MSIDLSANCILHCKMNDNAANKIVVDTSGQGNDGTSQRNTDVLSAIGKLNCAFRNDDSIPDYTKFPSSAAILGTTGFSVSFWMKLVDYNLAGAIVSQRISSSNVGIWTVSFTVAKKIRFMTYNEGYGINLTTNNPVPNDSDWHWILCQRQMPTGWGHIWIDNGNVDYVSQATGCKSLNSHPIYYGSNFQGNYPVDAYLDCFGLWGNNKFINAEERAFLWNNGLGTENLKSCTRPLVGGSLAGKRGLT